MTDPAWAPSPSHLALLVPDRTRTVTTPGVEEPAWDFTTDTEPTRQQVLPYLEQGTAWVDAAVPNVPESLHRVAQAAATYRAAGLLERAHPRQDGTSPALAASWLELAASTLEDLQTAAAARAGLDPTPGVPGDAVPVWSYPAPVPWGNLIF